MNTPPNFISFLLLFKIPASFMATIGNNLVHFITTWADDPLALERAPPKFDEQGLTPWFMENGISVVIFIIASFAFVYFVEICSVCFKKVTGKTWLFPLVRRLKWNFAIRFVMTNYCYLLCTILLQFTNLDTENALAISSQVLNAASALFVLLFPLWLTYMVNTVRKQYEEQEFGQKYGAITDDVVKKGAFFCKNFTTVLYVRKILFMGSIVLLYKYTVVNLIFLMLQSIMLALMIYLIQPFERVTFNLKNTLQEVAFISIDMILILINYNVVSQDKANVAGWVMIAICCLLIVYNLVFVVKDQLVAIQDAYLLIKNFLCSEKKPKRKLNWVRRRQRKYHNGYEENPKLVS